VQICPTLISLIEKKSAKSRKNVKKLLFFLPTKRFYGEYENCPFYSLWPICLTIIGRRRRRLLCRQHRRGFFFSPLLFSTLPMSVYSTKLIRLIKERT